MKKSFTKNLLKWHAANRRSMPWKETRDPYKIWLSEIILQQTRVTQGLPYYERITKKFPTVQALAHASEDEVLKLWEGLGYYTRARNMHRAAKQVLSEFEGTFPDTYESLLTLKGVGPYSAAAIASFAYDLPHAVVDGNVFRVLARYFGISEAVDDAEGKKSFSVLAQKLLDKNHPAEYNQAIMNFGAMVCKPANPGCAACIFNKDCFAFLHGATANFPVKGKKIVVKRRWFNYLVMESGADVIIEKRTSKDIWKGLYQFPILETHTYQSENEFLDVWRQTAFFSKNNMSLKGISKMVEHKLTHQSISAQFFRVQVKDLQNPLPHGWLKVKRAALQEYGFPKLIVNYINSVMLS